MTKLNIYKGSVMKKFLLLTSLFAAMVVMTGCGGQTPDVADETESEKVKTVQKDASDTTTKENTVEGAQDANETATLDGAQDKEETKIQTAEDTVESIYFDYDKFFIRNDMRGIVEKNGEVLNNDTNKDYRIKIEGNCDEWGSDEYNYALGLKRAASAKKALEAQGVDGSRVTLVSYGEANPVCTEKTKDCWQKNRRADFKVLP